MPSQSWSAPAEPGQVAGLRRHAVAFAGEQHVPDPPIADLRLAVSEAVTNVVLHAYRDDDRPGTVTVTVDVHPGERKVTVRVRDEGSGVHPRSDSPGMGLGLPLIAQVADELEIGPASEGAGTELCMTFGFETPTLH
jgi:serine/threonine-protein kinase RsbW